MESKGYHPDLTENKEAYISKMNRQIEDWQSRIDYLESIAQERNADENPRIRKEIDSLKQDISDTRRKLEELTSGQADSWPEGSLTVSGSYRHLKEDVEDAAARVKRK